MNKFNSKNLSVTLFRYSHCLIIICSLLFYQKSFSQITFTINNQSGNNYSITCTNSVIILSASSNYSAPVSYTWANSQSVSVTNSLSITSPASFTVTAGSGSITSSQTLAVGINTTAPGLTLTTTSNSLSCNIYSFQLHALVNVPSASYTWQVGSPMSECSGPYCIGYNAGNPKVIVKDIDNGCISTATLNITDNRIYPFVSAAPVSTISCPGGTVSLNPSVSGSSSDLLYTWIDGTGTITSGASASSLVVNSPGYYQVIVTNTLNGCMTQTVISVYACVGLESYSPETSLKIFPNPVQNRLNLEFEQSVVHPSELAIINSLGQVVLAQGQVNSKEEIDISFLSRGIYYLSIKGETTRKVFKIIKE